MAAFIRTNMVSEAVKDRMDVLIAVPQKKHIRHAKSPEYSGGGFEKEYQALFLLHDEGSSPGELYQMAAISRLADESGLLIVLPQGLLSYYTDYAERDINLDSPEKTGAANIEGQFTEMQYGKFLLDTVHFIRNTFPVSKERERTFIGGIGMGGFGALKWAAAKPEIFSAAFSISGITDLQWMMDQEPERKEQFTAIFGGLAAKGENDLAETYKKLAAAENPPKVLQIWERSCERAVMNEHFRSKLEGLYPAYSPWEKEEAFDWYDIERALMEAAAWLQTERRNVK